jgi:hypothetical protein
MEDYMKIATFRKNNWKRLMTEIEHRRVVPVIGTELLDVNIDGEIVPLYNYITNQLADRLDVDGLDDSSDVSEVAYVYSCRPGSDPSEPYYEVWDILQELDQVELPLPLRQLAQIEPFDLFVTTTCDDFMTKALDVTRFQGKSRTISLSFKKRGSVEDLPQCPVEGQLDPPVVYHVFGRANTLPSYVLTEENLLEFGHQWQDKDRRPRRLVVTLRDKFLLILGCSFENWLSRFFLCSLKSDALLFGKQQQGVVADEKTRRDMELSLFLSRCHTRLYSEGSAREFVAELAAQWQAYTSKRKTGPEPKLQREMEPDEFQKGAFFISYASEDRQAATRIKHQLESTGIDVWFDAQRLEPGDQYKKKILRYIEECSFFLPIISRHVTTSDRRFFRREWTHAIEDAQFRPFGLSFIIPLVIDDTSESSPFIPCEFTEVQWQRVPAGHVSKSFLDQCRRQIRKLRRQEEVRR